jgi:RNA polymerase sigma-70 factor, ECF subfamily
MTDRQHQFLSAFEPIRPNLERFVRAMARRWNDDPEAAQDLLADTIRQPEALLSFCFTIATRLHRKHRANAARYARLDEQKLEYGSTARAYAHYGDDSQDVHASHGTYSLHSEAEPLYETDDIARLYQALERLPDKQREAVIMFEILGFSMKEIQAAQGGTLIAVKVRVSRGRSELARILNPQHGI